MIKNMYVEGQDIFTYLVNILVEQIPYFVT